MERLIKYLETSTQHRHLYHFTDRRNLPSIAQHGLLSVRALEERGIAVAAPGGNEWSRDADARCGMDGYVHLCMFDSHPMEWMARQDGRLGETTFLAVLPDILRVGGVMFTDRVANDAEAIARPMAEIGALDLEIVYERADWKDPPIKERLSRAKKYEILIPDHVPVAMLRRRKNG